MEKLKTKKSPTNWQGFREKPTTRPNPPLPACPVGRERRVYPDLSGGRGRKIVITMTLMLLTALAVQAQKLTAFIGDNGKWGYKDRRGRVVITPEYDFLLPFYLTKEYIVFKSGDKVGFMDRKGTVLVTPKRYDNYYYPREGLIRVKRNGKWGLIDITDKQLTSFRYDDMLIFSDGLSAVSINTPSGKKWGYIDRTGKKAIPLIYDHAWTFHKKKARVKVDDEYFYINTAGEKLKKK